MNLSRSLDENIRYMESHLPLAVSFDLMTRQLQLGKTRAFFLGVNGFCKTEILQQIFSDLQNPLYMRDDRVEDILLYTESKIGYAQTSLENSWDEIFRNVLSGPAALFIGYGDSIFECRSNHLYRFQFRQFPLHLDNQHLRPTRDTSADSQAHSSKVFLAQPQGTPQAPPYARL